MCGLLVIVRKKGGAVPKDMLTKALESLSHRGPDESSAFFFENVAIGFNRLSIVDEASGHQPMFDETRAIVSVCNGEIYNCRELRNQLERHNHVFPSSSDCEVLPHLYQEDPHDFVTRLDGMFALAVLDTTEHCLILARDRVGIKPLVFFEDSEWFIAASEAKAILRSGVAPRELHLQGIFDSFAFNFVPGRQTAFRAIHHLPPATAATLKLDGSSLAQRQYWWPSFSPNSARLSWPGKYFKGLRASYTSCVASHMLSDRPVAAYLSGGIDSTVTALLLQNLASNNNGVQSYSITFPGEWCDESAAITATVERCRLRSEMVAAPTPSAENFERALWFVEQPQSSTLDIPMQALAARVRETGVKVVLSGEGADEMFGGYICYTLNQIRRLLDCIKQPEMRSFLAPVLANKFVGNDPATQYFRDFLAADHRRLTGLFGCVPAWLPIWMQNAITREQLFREPLSDSFAEGSALHSICEPLKSKFGGINEFDRSLYIELRTRLPNYILHRADRNSMSHSIEQRVPFLSNRMLEFVLEIPSWLKMLGLKEKFILRRAFASIVPKHILTRPKFPYQAPVEKLWSDVDDYRDHMMSPDQIDQVGIFVAPTVAKLRTELAGSSNAFQRRRLAETLTCVLSVQLLAKLLKEGFQS